MSEKSDEPIDPNKEARQRRAYWPLKAVLHSQEYENALTKIALEITKGDFDPENIYNQLTDAEVKLQLDIEQTHDNVLRTAWHEKTTEPNTDTNFERWKRRMYIRRVEAKRKERREGIK